MGLTSEGQIIAQTLMEENIFLYKGYCYDVETGLYLLTTRYYNPELGRWLNAADVSYLDPSSVNRLNLYAYCEKNPVMYTDRYRTSPEWGWVWWGLAGLVVIGLGVAVIISAGGLLMGLSAIAFAGGFVKGAITTVAVGFALSTGGVGGFAVGFFGSVTAQAIMSNTKFN